MTKYTSSEPVEPIPRVSIKRVLSTRNKLRSDLYLGTLVGKVLSQRLWEGLVNRLVRQLPKTIHPDMVEESVRYLNGAVLTSTEFDRLIWRLAGNLHKLSKLRPAYATQSVTKSEWMLVQLRDVVYKASKKSQGVEYQCQVVAGSLTPDLIPKWWSVKACGAIAPLLGFSNTQPVYMYQHPFEFFGMRLFAYFDADACLRAGEPVFQKFKATSSCLTWNRRLIELRDPYGRKCPFKFKETISCFSCKYGKESCPYATHSRDYAIRRCRGCGKDHAFFDDTLEPNQCILCNSQ